MSGNRERPLRVVGREGRRAVEVHDLPGTA